MSYQFKVKRDESGLHLVEPHASMLQHVPHGEFTVSGHHSTDHTGGMHHLSVQLSGPDELHLYAATQARASKPRPGATQESPFPGIDEEQGLPAVLVDGDDEE